MAENDGRNYTTNLEMVLPKQSEQYNVDDFNGNFQKIDDFAGQIPSRALVADELKTARKINGVDFKGNQDITIPTVNLSGDQTVEGVKTFSETIQGNIASATKAIQDRNGDIIDETYMKTADLTDQIYQSKAKESGNISFDKTVLDDIISYKNSSFDKSKFTVVGSPTITEDGIANGFGNSGTNYIKFSPIQLGNYNSWQVITPKFKVSGYSGNQYILQLNYNEYFGGIQLFVSPSGKLAVQLASSSSSDGDILRKGKLDVITNTYYQIKIEFTGTEYIVYYKIDNTDWTEYARASSTAKFYNALNTFRMGFPGLYLTIDLKQFSITVDGVEVFNGHKEGIDVLKPNDFQTVTTLYAYKFNNETIYADATSNVTELYNADGSYFTGTKWAISEGTVKYKNANGVYTESENVVITSGGVVIATLYAFKWGEDKIYANSSTTPTTLLNEDGTNYTGTNWYIESGVVKYNGIGVYTSGSNVTLTLDNTTCDAGVKISEDGIASNMNASKYIQFAGISLSNSNEWEIITPYITISSRDNWYNKVICFWHYSNTAPYGTGLRIGDYNRHVFLGFDWGEGSNSIQSTEQFLDGTKLRVKISFSNGTYKLFTKKIGDGWAEQGSLSGSNLPDLSSKDFKFCNFDAPSNYTYPFDLNAFKIYVDGNLVYQPCLKIPYTQSAEQYGSKIVDEQYRNRVEDAYEQGFEQRYYTLQENKKGNYQVIGSPTISSDFIFSGDGSSSGANNNYLTFIAPSFTNTSVIEVELEIKTPPSFGLHQGYFSFKTKSWLGLDTYGRIIFSNNGGNSPTVMSQALSTDTLYNIKIIIDTASSGFKYKKADEETWSQLYSYNVRNDIDTIWAIGQLVGAGQQLKSGYIDLESFKVYIDGKEAYNPVIQPNFTLPMGELYGMIEQRVKKQDLKEIICIIKEYAFSDANAFCWDLSNGWRIQGARQTVTSSGTITVPLLKPFTTNQYLAFKNYCAGVGTQLQDNEGSIFGKTTTSFQTNNSTSDTNVFDWIAIGR